MAIAIVGVSFVALMQLWAVCTQQNRIASDVTTAFMLAEQIQELTAPLPLNDPATGFMGFGTELAETIDTFDDIDDFDGQTFSPPIDAARQPLLELSAYTQRVTVVPVNGTDLDGNLNGLAISKSTYTGAMRVTVSIERDGREAARLSWIRVDR